MLRRERGLRVERGLGVGSDMVRLHGIFDLKCHYENCSFI